MGLLGDSMAVASVFLLLQYYRYGSRWRPVLPFITAVERNYRISTTDEQATYEKFRTSI